MNTLSRLALVAGFFIAMMAMPMTIDAPFGKGEYWYDAQAANAAAAFFPNHLRFTKGQWAGKPFKLQPWQEEKIIRPFFGWKRHDHQDPAKCTRRYRRVYVEVPRKNGKTELAAGMGLMLLLGDGELGGEGYAIAANTDQARIVFNAASSMVSYSPTLGEHLELFKTSIYCPQLQAGFYPLSGKAEGKHGKNPSFIIGDEVHEWATGDLYTNLNTGMAARMQPAELLITTAGSRKGYGWEWHQRAEKILEGSLDDPETLVVIFAASPDDDWNDPKIWEKANPNFNISVKPSYLQARYRDAVEDPSEENNFKNYHLNLWTEQNIRWIPMTWWNACTRNRDDSELWQRLDDELRGRPCYGGLDLASTEDVAAYVLLFPPTANDPRYILLPRLFIPSENIKLRVKKYKVPYDKWVAWGALQATEGDIIDYDFIEHAINQDAERFEIQSIAYDPWHAQGVVTSLTNAGRPMEKFAQTIYNYASPTKLFKTLVKRQAFEHGNHPVLRWMASNIAVKTDPNDNVRPDKQKSTEKIDGIVASIMALALATSEEDQLIALPDDYEVMCL